MIRISLARIFLTAVVAALPATLPAQDKIAVQQVALEKESFELISQIEDVARSVQYNTDVLRTHGSQHLSRWTNHHHLSEVKNLINKGLNPALNRLTAIEPQLPEWERHAIAKMLDSARTLAMDTNSAILKLNENGAKPIILNDDYRAFLDTMDEHANNLASTADAAGDYASALDHALEAGLRLPNHK